MSSPEQTHLLITVGLLLLEIRDRVGGIAVSWGRSGFSWPRLLVGGRFGCWLGRSLLNGSPTLGVRALSTQRKPRLDWVRAGRYHSDANAG